MNTFVAGLFQNADPFDPLPTPCRPLRGRRLFAYSHNSCRSFKVL